MDRYITRKEIEDLLQAPSDSLQKRLYMDMCQRVSGYIRTDGLKAEKEQQQEWYHLVWGKLSDACFVYRVTGDRALGQWIHNRVMELAALDEDAWIGPWFRPRRSGPPVGTLETAKIALALCEACLNASEVFSEEELSAVQRAMSDKGLVLLGRHLDKLFSDEPCMKNNWFMVTNCAYGMTAAVLGRKAEVQHALEVLKITLSFFDEDSYGEPLNYAEMASTYVNLLGEVFYRLGYMTEEDMPLKELADMLSWYVLSIQGLQYTEEYGAGVQHIGEQHIGEPGMWIPIAFNFGDSNLHMYFQSDKFIQLAVRLKDRDPEKAGLASWLFHLPFRQDEKGKRSYAGDFYGMSYLGLLALPHMASPISPDQAKLPTVQRFRVGHILARDSWENPRMTAAIAAGAEQMQISSHKHSDQNSFLLTVGKERMLIDPGMCCYRLQSQQEAKAEDSHNMITLFKNGKPVPQHVVSGRMTADTGQYINRLQVFEAFQDGWIVASDAAKLYDSMDQAVRIWVFCMPGMMFVADYVVSGEPLQLHTSFVMNNEDNKLKTNVYNAHRLVFRRGTEAMKLFNPLNLVDGREVETELAYDWTYAHHRYGIQPNSPGQGKEGSGLIYRWTCKEEGTELRRLHTLMMDEEKNIKYWHLRQADDFFRLEAPDHEDTLDFKFTEDGFAVRRKGQTKQWSLKQR